ncbi:Golgi phosphoprotein 3 GPP34 [Actinomycetospora succinea]|uniref:Golgi phosphoprotein 3 GPP34 n=1 Tax=Actinomycetospora succinea TaxID=663603 RepID=A0A4R6UWD4_9PSEU|nr:GPP34 family phosphoprotein [Actinomycetospora succinea]TDQ51670.1 Golgi phosphoprotein 3 GPP34 [Actinomycetospora succinea]
MRTAEDLALLLHDPDTGAPLVDSTSLPRGLAGAVVLQLVLDDRARLEERRWKTVMGIGDRTPTGDHVLDLALERLPTDPTPKAAIEKLQSRVKDPLMAGLVHDGSVRLEERTFLGMARTPYYPAADRRRRDAVAGRMRSVLVDGVAPTTDDAALVALLRAVRAEHKVVPEGQVPKRALRDRSKVIAEGEWAGEAVRRAIADVYGAIAAVTAAGAATTGT